MAEVIRMPKMSDTMVEGVIATWLKKVGDPVKAGDILAEVETDKATMELEAYESGTLLYIGVAEKQAAPINGVIAIIGKPNEDITGLLAEIQQVNTTATNIPTPTTATNTSPTSPSPSTTHTMPTVSTIQTEPQLPILPANQRVAASPLAKKMAQIQGYDLTTIQGTGEGGRIIKRDIEGLALNQSSVNAVAVPAQAFRESYEQVPVSQMRKTIARRLTESTTTAPHFYLTMSINMDKLVDARARLNVYSPIKITFNDIFIKAAALAIRKHPAINAAWLGDAIRYNNHVHIGVAMAIEAGLVVPKIQFADHKPLSQIAMEVKHLTQRAQNNQLQPADWEGSTFTISNLGMLGIESFTAIINPPNACILAVGAIQQVPVVQEGVVVPGHVMKVTLSCDHRVVDGAVGAAFLQTLQELLEEPLKLLL
jgi:pyruvate dehydrogenase E2 component (dihydrolipoamide acetyltransferase)